MRASFSTLNYSSVNEDWRTELAALRLSGPQHVLCVTGSGARPLDLLAAAPVRVLAVDCNPAQTALLQLKAAAIQALGFDEYAAFVGLHPASASWRRGVLRAVADRMPVESREYWSRHEGPVARGVLYQGRWERYHARLARLVRLVYPGRVRALLGFDDLLSQRAWVTGRWNDPCWRAAFVAGFSRPVVRALRGDAAYCAVPCASAARRLHARMGRLLERVLARHSFMVGLALTGRLPLEDLPPHLTPAGHRALRERLSGLEVATADVRTVVAGAGARRIDRFSLSDLGSFLEEEQLGRLLAAIAGTAEPGARVVLREFLVGHAWPAALGSCLRREATLEARLARDDRSFAYDFAIAEVARG